MRHFLLALAFVLFGSLGGCSALGGGGTADIAGCVAALVASGTTDPKALFGVAVNNASCKALASDVLQALINSVSSGQAAAMKSGRR